MRSELKRPECDRLEDFLGGWLPDDDVREFQAHLLRCEACRESADLRERVDKLLTDAALAVDVPRTLVKRIEQEIVRQSWIRAGTMAAVAAGLLVMVCGTAWLLSGFGERLVTMRAENSSLTEQGLAADRVSVDHQRTTELTESNAESARTVVVDVHSHPENETIAVQLPSKNPRVTIFMVYPAIRVSDSVESVPSNL
jgi:anti-sigma factor RsiW